MKATVSEGDRKINNDTNGGQNKKCDAAKEYCKGPKESPTFLPVAGREMMRAGERRMVVWVHGTGQRFQVAGLIFNIEPSTCNIYITIADAVDRFDERSLRFGFKFAAQVFDV